MSDDYNDSSLDTRRGKRCCTTVLPICFLILGSSFRCFAWAGKLRHKLVDRKMSTAHFVLCAMLYTRAARVRTQTVFGVHVQCLHFFATVTYLSFCAISSTKYTLPQSSGTQLGGNARRTSVQSQHPLLCSEIRISTRFTRRNSAVLG